jgi:hypothetical protein
VLITIGSAGPIGATVCFPDATAGATFRRPTDRSPSTPSSDGCSGADAAPKFSQHRKLLARSHPTPCRRVRCVPTFQKIENGRGLDDLLHSKLGRLPRPRANGQAPIPAAMGCRRWLFLRIPYFPPVRRTGWRLALIHSRYIGVSEMRPGRKEARQLAAIFIPRVP